MYEYAIRTNIEVSETELSDMLAGLSFETINDTTVSVRDGPYQDVDHIYARYYVADTEDRDAVVSALDSELNTIADISWAEVESRHTYREYEQDMYLNDPSYYPSHLASTLRTEPSITTNLSEYSISVEVEYVIDGSEKTASDTITIEQVKDKYMRLDLIVADTDGISVISGKPHGKPKNDGWPELSAHSGIEIASVTPKKSVERLPESGVYVRSMIMNDEEMRDEVVIGTIPEGI